MTAAKLRGVLGLLSVIALASLPLGEARASNDLVCSILWGVSSASESCSQATITYVEEKCEITAKCDRVGSSYWWDTAKVKLT